MKLATLGRTLSAALMLTAAPLHAEEPLVVAEPSVVTGERVSESAGNSLARVKPPLVPAEQKGKWTFSMSEGSPDLKKISGDKQKKIRGRLQELLRVVTATPAMTQPIGFETRFWGSITSKDRFDICTGKNCPPSRPTAVLAMMIGRYEEKGGKLKAAFNTPATMDISINNLGHVFSSLPVLYKDADGFLLPEPQANGTRAGIPAFLNDGHAVAVIAKPGQPLWLPVSRERYLQAAIAAAAKAVGQPDAPPRKAKKGKKPSPGLETATLSGKPILVEESRTWIDPAAEKLYLEKSRSITETINEPPEILQARLQKLRDELAAATPEQRRLQARVDMTSAVDGQSPPLVPSDSSGGVAVVTPNFRYFNSRLAPESVQLLVVQWKFDGKQLYDPESTDITDTLNNRTMLEIYKSMDWGKLKSTVNQTAP